MKSKISIVENRQEVTRISFFFPSCITVRVESMKLAKILILIAAVIPIFACMSLSSALAGLPQNDPTYSIESTRFPTDFVIPSWSYVSFEGAGYLQKKEDDRASAESRPSDYSFIPNIGIVLVQTNSYSIDGADPSHWLFIITDSTGLEIVRKSGERQTPDYEVGRGSTRWYAYSAISVKGQAKFPLTVRAVDSYFPQDYYEYKIVATRSLD